MGCCCLRGQMHYYCAYLPGREGKKKIVASFYAIRPFVSIVRACCDSLSGGKKKLLHQFYAICPFVFIVFHICRGLEKNFGSVHTIVAGEFGQHWHPISCTPFSCTARGEERGIIQLRFSLNLKVLPTLQPLDV